jgi:hypothetical protein
MKKKLRPLTQEDFYYQKYEWTNISKYALSEDGYLIRLEKVLSDGSPVYLCLFEGWWEAVDACSSISAVREAEPISPKVAKAIMKKEEKPLAERPKERNYWVS